MPEEPIRQITTPSEKIVNAIAGLIYAFQCLNAVQEGRLAIATLKTDVQLIEDETGQPMGMVSRKYTSTQFEDSAWNGLWAAMAVGAIAIDEALDDAFGEKTDVTHHGDTDLDAARTIIYQVRNAFAHEPYRPTWRCKPKYHRTYRVEEIQVTWNGEAVHGEGLAPVHVGGWPGYFRLLEYARRRVEAS